MTLSPNELAKALPRTAKPIIDITLPSTQAGRTGRLRVYDVGPLGLLLREEVMEGTDVVAGQARRITPTDWCLTAKFIAKWTQDVTNVSVH